jgi:hypothetical protein
MEKKSIRMADRFLGIIALAAGVFMYTSCPPEVKDNNDIKPKPASEEFHVYLAFGQSNMVGYLGLSAGASGGSLDSTNWVATNEFDTPPENFKVMAAANDNKNPYSRKKGEWYEAKPPLVRKGNGLSPADFFGRTIAEKVADRKITVGVIVVAVDGCQIKLFSKDKDVFKTYIRGEASYMQNQAVAYVDSKINSITSADFDTDDYPYKRLVDLARQAQDDGAIIKGIIMHQGESGGNFTGKTYAQTVRQIYNDLCEDLELRPGEIPFLAGQAVGNNNSNIASIPSAFADLLNTAFVISSEGCLGWDPNNSSNQNERIHFSFDGYRELGTRYGKKMLELLY